MDLGSIIYAIFLGAVQGVTEFLPVSSSAHLIIVSWFYSGKSLPLSLNVALHIGTLVAVLVYFRKDWFSIFQSLLKLVGSGRSDHQSRVILPGLIIG